MAANALNHRPELKRLLDEMLLSIPGVKGGQAFGYPCYKVFGRVFAFVGGEGMGLKLPEDRVDMLLDGDQFHPFEPKEGLVWREWMSFDPVLPEECLGLLPLLHESIEYVVEKEFVQ